MSRREDLRITLPDGGSVSGLLDIPDRPLAAFVFAHGAGAGMQHRFMCNFAAALCTRGVAVLRYQFPFIENGSKRPDAPKTAHATVRAAVDRMNDELPDIRLFAGGKSFGGRMTSQAQSIEALRRVEGLVFVGFPLHPAKKPAMERAQHLAAVECPMLFLQGTRDDLADLGLLRPVVMSLDVRASLVVVDDADHAFHVRVSSGPPTTQGLTAWRRRRLSGWHSGDNRHGSSFMRLRSRAVCGALHDMTLYQSRCCRRSGLASRGQVIRSVPR